MSGNLINYARVSVPGGWLVLTEGPYSLAEGTMERFESKLRSVTASNELTAGEWTVVAVESNETFPFNIRVKGDGSQGSCFAAARALKQALQRRNFVLETTLGDWVMQWNCFAADVTIEASKPLLYAAQAVVSTTMSALPQEA